MTHTQSAAKTFSTANKPRSIATAKIKKVSSLGLNSNMRRHNSNKRISSHDSSTPLDHQRNMSFMAYRNKHTQQSSTGSLLGTKYSYYQRKVLQSTGKLCRYLRENRLEEAERKCELYLSHVIKNTGIDWCIIQGPCTQPLEWNDEWEEEKSFDQISEYLLDINTLRTASAEVQMYDIIANSELCWIDLKLFQCKLNLFYKYYQSNSNTNEICKTCVKEYTSILDFLHRCSMDFKHLSTKSYYYRFVEAECRAGLAYAIVKSERYGYASYAGIALEHCRQAMKLDPFHTLAHGVYGYLLDRCLDKFESAREYLEYAIHLDRYSAQRILSITAAVSANNSTTNVNRDAGSDSDVVLLNNVSSCGNSSQNNRLAVLHVWYAMLLTNFESEFRDLEHQMSKKLRSQLDNKKFSSNTVRVLDIDSSDEEEKESEVEQNSPAMFIKQLSNHTSYQRQRHSLTKQMILTMAVKAHTMHKPKAVDEKENIPSTNLTETESKEKIDHTFDHLLSGVLNSQLEIKMSQRFGNDFMKHIKPVSDKPEEHFRTALKIEKYNSTFHSIYGVWLVQQERYKNALKHFENAYEFNNNNPIAIHNLAWIYTLPIYSRFEDARMFYKKALAIITGGGMAGKRNSAYVPSVTDESTIENIKRQRSSNITSTVGSDDVNTKNLACVHFNLARLLCIVFEDLDNARHHFYAARKYDKKNPHIHYFFALYWKFYEENHREARIFLNNSDQYIHKSQEWEVNSYVHYVQILKDRKKFLPAKFLLQRVLKLDQFRKRQVRKLMSEIKIAERRFIKMNRAKHESMEFVKRKSNLSALKDDAYAYSDPDDKGTGRKKKKKRKRGLK